MSRQVNCVVCGKIVSSSEAFRRGFNVGHRDPNVVEEQIFCSTKCMQSRMNTEEPPMEEKVKYNYPEWMKKRLG